MSVCAVVVKMMGVVVVQQPDIEVELLYKANVTTAGSRHLVLSLGF